jgi:hypothetical protein
MWYQVPKMKKIYTKTSPINAKKKRKSDFCYETLYNRHSCNCLEKEIIETNQFLSILVISLVTYNAKLFNRPNELFSPK